MGTWCQGPPKRSRFRGWRVPAVEEIAPDQLIPIAGVMCQPGVIEHGSRITAWAHAVPGNGVAGGTGLRTWKNPEPAGIMRKLIQQPGVRLSAQHRLALPGPPRQAPALPPPHAAGVVEPRLMVL